MFILPEFQGQGFAQQAIKAAEALYPQAEGWQLDTIKEERKLCHLYEKMGYKRTGKEEVLQDNMTIVYFAK
jgi:GNAT superfamily N-acetyltransferase